MSETTASARGRPRIVRLIAKAALCVALGLIVSIGVAWAIARWPPRVEPGNIVQWSTDSGAAWFYRAGSGHGWMCLDGVSASAWTADGRRSSMIQRPPSWSRMRHQPDLERGTVRMREEAFGWPMLAMSHARTINDGERSWTILAGFVVQTPRPGDDRHIIVPFRPIAPGLALNTVVYALALWLLMIALAWFVRSIRTLRPRWRQYRGRCPSCAYDLKHDMARGCPECGWRREPPERAPAH